MSAVPEIDFSDGFEESLCARLAESGVVKVFGAVSTEQLELLNREFEVVISSEETGIRDLGVEVGSAKDVMRMELEGDPFPELVNYFSQGWMQRTSDLYWGDSRVLNDHVFVSREVPGTTHLAQGLHFDVQETLKFFLYLNDVTEENGAFSCVPGSVSLTKRKREELGNDLSYDNRGPSRDHPFSEDEIVPVEALAGTLIVFTTEVWHRAGLVKVGERKVMRGHTRTPAEVSDESENAEPQIIGPEAGLFRRIISKLR